MENTLTLIYDSIDIIVALIIGIWFIATKGKLTKTDNILHKIPSKWLYIAGYIAIFYSISQIIKVFFV